MFCISSFFFFFNIKLNAASKLLKSLILFSISYFPSSEDGEVLSVVDGRFEHSIEKSIPQDRFSPYEFFSVGCFNTVIFIEKKITPVYNNHLLWKNIKQPQKQRILNSQVPWAHQHSVFSFSPSPHFHVGWLESKSETSSLTHVFQNAPQRQGFHF